MLLRRPKSQEDDGLEVDLSPLIDVTFLLLIFFVLTTSFTKEKQLDINRPSASTANAVAGEPLRVALDMDGSAYVDGQRVAPWLLQGRIKSLLRTTKAREVLLIADERVPSGRMVEVIDQCRLAGAKNVAISTKGAP